MTSSITGRASIATPGEKGVDSFLQSLAGCQPSSPLAVFLIDRACRSRAVANSLYWFLKVEAETDVSGLFRNNLNALLYTLYSKGGAGGGAISLLAKQIFCLDRWIKDITACQRDARDTSLRPMFTDKYAFIQEALNALFVERGLTSIPEGLPSFPNPLDTSQSIVGLTRCSHIFKSAMVPCVVDVMAIREAPLEVEVAEASPRSTSGSPRVPSQGRKQLLPRRSSEEGDGGSGGGGPSEEHGVAGEEEEEDEDDWGMKAGDLSLDSTPTVALANNVTDALTVGDPVSPARRQQTHAALRESGVSGHEPSPSTLSGKRTTIMKANSVSETGVSDGGADALAPAPAPHRFTQKLFFKQGDDLRTDQLILNLFSLMDSLLKKVNLDLRMRVYSVLATSQKDGIMEFVDKSQPVQVCVSLPPSLAPFYRPLFAAFMPPAHHHLTSLPPIPLSSSCSVSLTYITSRLGTTCASTTPTPTRL